MIHLSNFFILGFTLVILTGCSPSEPRDVRKALDEVEESLKADDTQEAKAKWKREVLRLLFEKFQKMTAEKTKLLDKVELYEDCKQIWGIREEVTNTLLKEREELYDLLSEDGPFLATFYDIDKEKSLLDEEEEKEWSWDHKEYRKAWQNTRRLIGGIANLCDKYADKYRELEERLSIEAASCPLGPSQTFIGKVNDTRDTLKLYIDQLEAELKILRSYAEKMDNLREIASRRWYDIPYNLQEMYERNAYALQELLQRSERLYEQSSYLYQRVASFAQDLPQRKERDKQLKPEWESIVGTGGILVEEKKEAISTLLGRINSVKPQIDQFYQEFSQYLRIAN